MAHYPYCFTINRLSLPAHLGWLGPERSVKQPVSIDIRLYFLQAPVCMTDDDGAFLDYHGLCKAVQKTVEAREYRLIEFMAAQLFAVAREFVDATPYKDTKIWMRLTKSEAPVMGLQDGASFVLSDLPEGASVVASV